LTLSLRGRVPWRGFPNSIALSVCHPWSLLCAGPGKDRLDYDKLTQSTTLLMEGPSRSGENQNPRSLSMSVATLTSNEGPKEFKAKRRPSDSTASANIPEVAKRVSIGGDCQIKRTRETDFQKDSFVELYILSPGKSVYEATISNKRDCLG
jgi:hypothetical protein